MESLENDIKIFLHANEKNSSTSIHNVLHDDVICAESAISDPTLYIMEKWRPGKSGRLQLASTWPYIYIQSACAHIGLFYFSSDDWSAGSHLLCKSSHMSNIDNVCICVIHSTMMQWTWKSIIKKN